MQEKSNIKKINKLWIICLLILGAFAVNGDILEASPEERAIISVVPVHAPEKIWQLFNPFVEYLNKNNRIKWELKHYTSHDVLEQAICNNEVHITLSRPFLAYRLYKRCGVKPILLALDDEGKVSMKILLITMDPEVRNIADLKGKRVGLFKPVTAAHIVSKAMLEIEGINEQNTQFIVFQGLDRLIEAMLAGTVSAIGLRDNVLSTLRDQKYRELKVSDPIPGFVFMASPNASENIKDIFVKSMLKLNPKKNKDHRLLMQGWDETIKYGFTKPTADYLHQLQRNYEMYGRFAK